MKSIETKLGTNISTVGVSIILGSTEAKRSKVNKT
jgi:hypothetical protein